jgi:ubiquinone/menaquinone biosynthesis C-methylase UbiE
VNAPRVDRGALAAVYGDGVESYDRIWSPVIRPAAESVVEAMGLCDAARVLDVGAGTGALTVTLHDAAPSAVVVSLEPARAMLRYAAEHRGATGCQADATALPIADASVDAVLLAYVLFHLLDPVQALMEAQRVARPGDSVGSVTWASETASRAAEVWDDTLAQLAVPVPPAHGNHSGLDSEAAVASLHRDAGLAAARVWREQIEHVFTPERFWELRTGSGSNRVRLSALSEPDRRRVLDEMRERFAQLDPQRDYVFRGELICAVSQKPS